MKDALYDRLCAAGALTYSEHQRRLTRAQLVLAEPPAVLALSDLHWMPPEDLAAERTAALEPFAVNAAGELFAFHPPWQNAIVLVAPGENRARGLAPHLEGLLYRKMLETVAYLDERFWDITSEQFVTALEAQLRALKPYLRASWCADLEALADRAPQPWTLKLARVSEQHVSRLSQHELNERVERELAFAHLGETFSL